VRVALERRGHLFGDFLFLVAAALWLISLLRKT